MRRYIAYDIDTANNDYQDLYDFLEEIGADELTESFYSVDNNLKFEDFCKRLEKATNKGDTVFVIYSTDKSIEHKKIR